MFSELYHTYRIDCLPIACSEASPPIKDVVVVCLQCISKLRRQHQHAQVVLLLARLVKQGRDRVIIPLIQPHYQKVVVLHSLLVFGQGKLVTQFGL